MSASTKLKGSESGSSRPTVLVLSLLKERELDDLHSHLMTALEACSTTHLVDSVRNLKKYFATKTLPRAILVVDSAISKAEYSPALTCLIEYTKAGGIVIAACNFSNHISYGDIPIFFAKWGLSWDAGTYVRTTVYLNGRAGGVPGMSLANLPESYSLKSLSLLNVSPNNAVYNPSSTSRIESRIFAPDHFRIDPSEAPAAFAHVGEGYLAYVGDVNMEVESAKVILAMCQLPVSAVGPDKRQKINLVMSNGRFTSAPAGPSDGVALVSDAIRQAGHDFETGCKIEGLPEADMPLNDLGTAPRGGSTPSASTTNGLSSNKSGPATSQTQDAKKSAPTRPRRPRETEVEARADKRAQVFRVKREKAEEWKNLGNAAFKRQDWDSAVKAYMRAIATNGPRPVYCANLAAAYLKLGCNEEAEDMATDALRLDPKNIKARYRRGLARKEIGDYRDAVADFKTCLKLDPTSVETQKALAETERLRDENPDSDGELGGHDSDYCVGLGDADPALSDEPEEITEDSDSSDFEHEGNGTPCRFYNRDGCRNRAKCKFRHGPTPLSTRDELGRNVCNYWLLGQCKYGDDKCFYAHSKEYLPEQKLKNIGEMRIIASDLERYKSYGKGGRRGARELEREMEEREMNYGFTDAEAEELLCQGVKPWDNDAWDVLAALNGHF